MKNTGIIILAAGSSSRLGQPKQLLIYKGKTLLQHVHDEALKAKISSILIVCGSNAKLISENINSNKAIIITNKEWHQGIASSIHVGISELLKQNPQTEKFILSVCDQPFISSKLFENLIKEYKRTGMGILASFYADTKGTPVLFHKKYANELMALQGNEGAKKLFKIYQYDFASVPFENGEIDVDTLDDYLRLMK